MNKLVPTGHYVLVEDEEIVQYSSGGIMITTGDFKDKEQAGQEFGRIIAFGPIAYKDFKGCKGPEDWGVAVGDLVEYNGRYEGKLSSFCREKIADESERRFRFIPDQSIVGKLEG